MFSRLQTQTLAFLVLLVFATAWLVTALTCKNLQHYWLQINHQLTRIFMQYSMHDLKLIFTKSTLVFQVSYWPNFWGCFCGKLPNPWGRKLHWLWEEAPLWHDGDSSGQQWAGTGCHYQPHHQHPWCQRQPPSIHHLRFLFFILISCIHVLILWLFLFFAYMEVLV